MYLMLENRAPFLTSLLRARTRERIQTTQQSVRSNKQDETQNKQQRGPWRQDIICLPSSIVTHIGLKASKSEEISL